MKEALKLALEALELANSCVDGYYIPKGRTQLPEIELAITAIKEALAQQEQEPVAYLCENAVGHKYFRWKKPSSTYKPIALYTSPPQRTWVGLNLDERAACYELSGGNLSKFADQIEAKLKEKNI